MSDMGSYYQCSDPDSNEKNWTGHIRPLNINRNEFEVTARGSTFHLLVGKHAYGKYLCIPNWGIGTEISSLSDCFWNRGRLEQDYSELSGRKSAGLHKNANDTKLSRSVTWEQI
mgnify:CR=1 FL=1